jgi:hypothetical protein
LSAESRYVWLADFFAESDVPVPAGTRITRAAFVRTNVEVLSVFSSCAGTEPRPSGCRPSHAPGQRDPIGEIGWIGLRCPRCRIPREAPCALRGQTEGRQHADYEDGATLTGPLDHCRVLRAAGKNTPKTSSGCNDPGVTSAALAPRTNRERAAAEGCCGNDTHRQSARTEHRCGAGHAAPLHPVEQSRVAGTAIWVRACAMRFVLSARGRGRDTVLRHTPLSRRRQVRDDARGVARLVRSTEESSRPPRSCIRCSRP